MTYGTDSRNWGYENLIAQVPDDMLIGGSSGRSRWGKYNPQGKHGSYKDWPPEEVTKDLRRRVQIRRDRLAKDKKAAAEREYWKKVNEDLMIEAESRRVPTVDEQTRIDRSAQDDLDIQAADEADRTPIGGFNFNSIDVPVIQYLESSGLGDSLKVGDWNPRKSARDKKIRELKQRAGTPGEKAAAENKQSDEAKVDIPDFLTIRDMKEALQREGIGNIFDQEMDKYREQKEGLTIRERIDTLSKNKRLRDGLTTALKSQGLKIGKSVARNLIKGYFTWSLMH